MKNLDSSNDVLGIINRVSFFQAFSPSEREKIAKQYSQVQLFSNNETIFKKGETSDSFYVILVGSVAISINKVTLNTLTAGECFGEMGYLTGSERSADVVAHEKQTITLRIDQKLMMHLNAEEREKIKDRLLKKLVDRFQKMNQLVI